jgi:pyrimidine operon attenuation protein/uracil phosphoribosyltransferase
MDTRPAGSRTCLYDAAQLDVVLDSMAMQAAGLLTGKPRIMLVGVLRRGALLADMLQQKMLPHFQPGQLARMNLKIKRYSDDLKLLHPETLLTESPENVAVDLSGITVLVVDDVMYRGHSMLRAIEYLAAKNAEEIRTVVLVDRGATKLPVRCDIAGVRLDIAPGDIIECNVPPYETEFKIEVLQPPRG